MGCQTMYGFDTDNPLFIIQDLQVNFTQGLKAVWSSGKALHKSLEGRLSQSR